MSSCQNVDECSSASVKRRLQSSVIAPAATSKTNEPYDPSLISVRQEFEERRKLHS